ncbi:hypothetical protein [uncultured Enterovirga sp.]|uniref:hypothetical protein n=1 Tax=uncultured Enterovirga sp. TaxID=2026352 RepID=UPI0035CA93AE
MTVVGLFALSEAGCRLLATYPGSAFAWYLNIHVFRVFEQARIAASPLKTLFHPNALAISIVILGAIVVARWAEQRFVVAAFANVSFVGAVALAYTAWMGTRTSRSVSLPGFALDEGLDTIMVIVMLAASSVAALVSHLSFLGAIRDTLGGHSPEPDGALPSAR